MRELIYKDEAYKAIDNCIRDGWYRISPSDAKMNIRHLVSDANEADRLRGEWIVDISDYKSICSVCGKDEAEFICGTEDWYAYGLSNYCPNCGARMKGADDEISCR
jgi:hypothetical protein